MNRKELYARLFFAVSIISTLFLFLETLLQFLGTSICASEGCKIVARQTRFGDISIILLGLVTLLLITVLSGWNIRSPRVGRENFLNFILVVSLAGEGFFSGFQIFRLGAWCPFCLTVLGILTVLGMLRILSGHREVLAGYASLIALILLFYLVLPAGGPPLPQDQKIVLFYSHDCKYCSEIREELEKNNVEFAPLLVKEYSSTLRSLGVEQVPTLLINGPYQKTLLIGREAIRRYLLSLASQGAAPEKQNREIQVPPEAKNDSRPREKEPAYLFDPSRSLDQIFHPKPDEGVCPQDEKCD
jgi:glutaredoxin